MMKKITSNLARMMKSDSKKGNATGIFGVQLPEDVHNMRDRNLRHFIGNIPRIVYKTIEYLYKHGVYVEGIFRVSGSASEIQRLRECFNRGEDLDFNNPRVCSSPHIAAGLLKLYYRELPDSIVPRYLYECLCTAINSDYSPEDRRIRLRSIINMLPHVNYSCMSELMNLLKTVAENSEYNRMSSVNLAICIAPNLLRCDTSLNINDNIADTSNSTSIIKALIDDCSYIFEDSIIRI